MAVVTLHLINNDVGPQKIKSRAGDAFHLQAFVYPKTGNAGGGSVALSLNCTDSRGINGATTVVAITETVPATGSWSLLDGYATVPTGYDTVDPIFTLTSVPTSDYVFIDDALVREVTYAQQIMSTVFNTSALPASGAAAIPPANVGNGLGGATLLADIQALATTLLGSATSQQATGATAILQNIADAMHQITYGGGATGTPMDLTTLKNMFAGQPAATVVPPPNPSSSGLPTHGASGTGFTAGINSTGATQLTTSGGTCTKGANDNYAVMWGIYAVTLFSGTAVNSIPRFASFGSQNMASLTGPITIYNSGTEYWCLEGFVVAGPASGAQPCSLTVGSGVSNVGSVYGVFACVDTYSGVISITYDEVNAASGSSLTQTIASGANNLTVGAFAAVNYLGSEAITGYNKTLRDNAIPGTMQSCGTALAVGDAPGISGSLVFTASSSGGAWAAAGINLHGAGTTSLGSGFRVSRTSTGGVNAPTTTTPAVLGGSFFNNTPDSVSTADYTYVSSTNTLTVANAGWYAVTLSLLLTGSYSSNYILGLVLFHNGASAQFGQRFNQTGYANILNSTFIIYLNAGDTVQPGAYSNYGGTISTFTGEASGMASYFEVALLNRSLL